MGRLTKADIEDGLRLLGKFAHAEGETIELTLVGGAVMALHYEERDATKDVDSLIEGPAPASRTRAWAERVAEEKNWDADWLNEGAKGFIGIPSKGPIIFEDVGIKARMASVEQQLALKLAAWRDDIDIADAGRLLRELGYIGVIMGPEMIETLKALVTPYFPRGSELKACYALEELVEIHNADLDHNSRGDSSE